MSDGFKIVHCADLHLIPPERGGKAADPFVTFRRIIDFTNGQDAGLLLIAGDLYDSVYAPDTLIRAVQHELARCKAEVYICGGNHDYCGIGSPLCAPGYSENVHILTDSRLTRYEIPSLGAVLYGCSFDAPHSIASPLSGFEAKDEGAYRIGLLHADAPRTASEYAPLSLEQIDRANLHYLALGHVHSPQVLSCASKTVASYPGTPQANRFSDAGGGVNLVTVKDGVTTLMHHDLSARPYLVFEVCISGCETDAQCADRIYKAACDRCIPEQSCCLVTLSGSLSAGFLPSLSLIDRLLQSRFYLLQSKDKTLPYMDEDGMTEYSLQSIFLNKLTERIEGCTDEVKKELLLLARKYGMQAFYGEVDTDAD